MPDSNHRKKGGKRCRCIMWSDLKVCVKLDMSVRRIDILILKTGENKRSSEDPTDGGTPTKMRKSDSLIRGQNKCSDLIVLGMSIEMRAGLIFHD